MILDCRNVTLTLKLNRKELKIVEDLSLQIGAGEFCALIGESGSGKSMIARAIIRLLGPSRLKISGELRVCDLDIQSASEAQIRALRRNTIGIVFQEPMTSLNPIMPIGDQVGEKIAAFRKLPKGELRDEVDRLFLKAQLRNVSNIHRLYPHELSGGMRQRVMIAIALANNPRLLIADEPTTALDVTTQKEVLDIIKAEQEESGLAVLYISHDLALVSQYADSIAVLYAGVLMEMGMAHAVIGSPLHPYTKALLECIPGQRLDGRRKTEIPGTVARVDDWAPGCRFAPRCQISRMSCLDGNIGTAQPVEGRAVKCLYPLI